MKRAARRKLEHELGVPADTVDLDDFSFLTRIMYQAGSDGTEWGECESASACTLCLSYRMRWLYPLLMGC